jgi:hypothetical protein
VQRPGVAGSIRGSRRFRAVFTSGKSLPRSQTLNFLFVQGVAVLRRLLA